MWEESWCGRGIVLHGSNIPQMYVYKRCVCIYSKSPFCLVRVDLLCSKILQPLPYTCSQCRGDRTWALILHNIMLPYIKFGAFPRWKFWVIRFGSPVWYYCHSYVYNYVYASFLFAGQKYLTDNFPQHFPLASLSTKLMGPLSCHCLLFYAWQRKSNITHCIYCIYLLFEKLRL